MGLFIRSLLLFSLLFPLPSQAAPAREEKLAIQSFDRFALDGAMTYPAAVPVKRLVILLHGSGAVDMDADFSALSAGRAANFFFKDISQELSRQGFAVLRYHKRSYQYQLQLQKQAAFKQDPRWQAFKQNPLSYLLEDARAVLRTARKRFPQAKIYLLGHSQGTWLALQLAHQDPQIQGVALIGLLVVPLETLLFEQTVYRSQAYFELLDRSRDGFLSPQELEQDTSGTLANYLSELDLNRDGQLDLSEFKAGLFASLVEQDLLGQAYRRQEATYPRPVDILRQARFKVICFQGLWDNQTPAYQLQGIQLLAQRWQRDITFVFYPGLGHALDPRDSLEDPIYRPIDPGALAQVGSLMQQRFR